MNGEGPIEEGPDTLPLVCGLIIDNSGLAVIPPVQLGEGLAAGLLCCNACVYDLDLGFDRSPGLENSSVGLACLSENVCAPSGSASVEGSGASWTLSTAVAHARSSLNGLLALTLFDSCSSRRAVLPQI